MSVNLSKQTADLRALIEQLKHRCLEAEGRAAELQQQLTDMQQRLADAVAEKDALDTKYRNLQTGVSAAGSDPQRIAHLKAQYLAMVSELDACIATLQHE